MDSGAAILSATQGISAFNALLPPLRDVRRAHKELDLEVVADVRTGEIAASAITLAVGVLISALVRSAYPALIAFCISAILVIVYESVLRVQGATSYA